MDAATGFYFLSKLKNRYFIDKPPELDEVLGLMSEKINKDISFEFFKEMLINVIHKNLPKKEDVVILVLDLQDTIDSFKGKKSRLIPTVKIKKKLCV